MLRPRSSEAFLAKRSFALSVTDHAHPLTYNMQDNASMCFGVVHLEET